MKQDKPNVLEIQELKSKVSNFEKMIRAEPAEDRNKQITITRSLFNSVDKELEDGIVGSGLKVLNKEVARCYKELGIKKLDRLAVYKEDGVAAYQENILYINKDKFNAMVTNPKEFFKVNVLELERNGKIRFLAINDQNNVRSYIFDHEFGHYLFEKYEKSKRNAYHELCELYQKTIDNGYINKISEYAKFDKYEFFSELYAFSKQISCELPKFLLDFINEVKR